MARLVTTASGTQGIAASGNRQPSYIIVAVTDVNGVPVTGLGASNFTVSAMVVAPGGSAVNIAGVAAEGLAGGYLIKVVPVPAGSWRAGEYIFAIATLRGSDQGLTLASVSMH